MIGSKSKKYLRSFGAFLVAVALVTTAIGGATELGSSPVGDGIEDTTGIDTAGVSPVGDAEALVPVAAGLAAGVVLGVGAKATADHFTEPDKSELTQIDALETKASIHGNILTLDQKNDELMTVFSNRLKDTDSVARKIGQNALYRAYNNGTTTTLARTKAFEQIEDYYAGRQAQMLESWESTALTLKNSRAVGENTSNMTGDYPFSFDSNDYLHDNDGSDVHPETLYFDKTATITLVNGSTVTVTAMNIRHHYADPNNGDVYENHTWAPTLSNNWKFTAGGADGRSYLYAVNTPPPSADFNKIDNMVDLTKWNQKMSDIETKTQNVKNTLSNVYDSTSGTYQNGSIDNSDLIDPTLGADKFGPNGSFGTYTLLSYIESGYNVPDKLDNVGTMNITEHSTGTNTTGVLLSDGAPPNGEFSVGTRYNTSQITGPQLIIDTQAEEVRELNGEFTLTSVTSPSGASLANVSYSSVSYQTTDTATYQQALNESSQARAETEARQQKLRGGIGGGLLPGLPSFGFGGAGIIALAGAAIYLLGRD